MEKRGNQTRWEPRATNVGHRLVFEKIYEHGRGTDYVTVNAVHSLWPRSNTSVYSLFTFGAVSTPILVSRSNFSRSRKFLCVSFLFFFFFLPFSFSLLVNESSNMNRGYALNIFLFNFLKLNGKLIRLDSFWKCQKLASFYVLYKIIK